MTTVYIVFKGYVNRIGMKDETMDEWLIGVHATSQEAREAVMAFGDGKPFDTNGEMQITRYHAKSDSDFRLGPETLCQVKGGCKEWVRYEPYPVEGS